MASIKEQKNNRKKVKKVGKVVGRCICKGVTLDLVAEARGR